jgi:glycosyltransferase involved in cell wall biosynthesis
MTELPCPTISVVLSFANEEEVLPETVRRLRAVLDGQRQLGFIAGHELIFVNDASSDRSLEILLEAARQRDDIRIVNMSRNFGVTPCTLAGMDFTSGDLVVYLDTDLQDPPEVIPEMLKAWREGGQPDVVHTVRRRRHGETRIKLAITWLGYRILRCLSTVPIRIEAGDFKMLSRRVVEELRKLHEKKPFLRGLVAWVGFKQTEIYYERAPRAAGVTKFPVFSRKVIQNFLDSALISFSGIPLQLATFLGLLVSGSSFCYLLVIIVQRLLGYTFPGLGAVLATVLFLGGVQMLFLGIMGLYLNAIFVESKGRPNYIVESTIGFPNQQGGTSGAETSRSCDGNPLASPSQEHA